MITTVNYHLKEINVSHEKFIQREGNYSVIEEKIKV